MPDIAKPNYLKIRSWSMSKRELRFELRFIVNSIIIFLSHKLMA